MQLGAFEPLTTVQFARFAPAAPVELHTIEADDDANAYSGVKKLVTPSAMLPPFDTLGLVDSDAASVKRLPAIGVTSGASFKVAFERLQLDPSVRVFIEPAGGAKITFEYGGRFIATNTLKDRARDTLLMIARNDEAEATAEGQVMRVDAKVDKTLIASLALRVFSELKVRLQFTEVSVLEDTDDAEQSLSTPNTTTVRSVANDIWSQAGVRFIDMPDRKLKVKVKKDGEIDLNDKAELTRLLQADKTSKVAHVYWVRRHAPDRKMGGTYATTMSKLKSAASPSGREKVTVPSSAAGAGVIAFTEHPSDSDLEWPDGNEAWGYVIAHELGHLFGLTHAATRAKPSLAAALTIMFNDLPCGTLIRPSRYVGFAPANSRAQTGAIIARETILNEGMAV
ncbi:MAG: hypothetical protein U0271_33345 [Polyangiaceae bacterium]